MNEERLGPARGCLVACLVSLVLWLLVLGVVVLVRRCAHG